MIPTSPARTLSQVKDADVRERLHRILHQDDPGHHKRLWLVGILNGACDYSAETIINLIDLENQWVDYDPEFTAKVVRNLCDAPKKGGTTRGDSGGGTEGAYRPPQFASMRPPRTLDWNNYVLLSGAREFATCFGLDDRGKKKFSWDHPRFDPARYALFRTIEGWQTHIFYVDIDTDNPGPAWRRIRDRLRWHRWDLVKFSGGTGFHLVQAQEGGIPEGWNPEEKRYEPLYQRAEEVAMHLRFPFHEGDEDKPRPFVDAGIYNRRRLFRVLCKHMGTGRYSVPVFPEDNILDIEERSRHPPC